MKKLALFSVLVLTSFFAISCGSQKVVEKTQPVETKTTTTTTAVVQQETEKKIEEPKAIIYKDIADSKDPVIETSATLKDDTGIGFNYEGQNVLDIDFSTAWCGTKEGVGDWISYSFKEPVQAEKLGILPGFGRDEKIYFKNNRVKELKAVFTDVDGKTSEKTFSFPDKYQMNFVDLADVKFKSVKFVVSDIYKVNSKPDTCIAELDFWSDYVKNEDATAAMNYYKKYKESEALRPYDFIGKIVFSDQEPDKCNNPRGFNKSERDGYGYLREDGTFIFFGTTIYVTAYVNDYGKEGDLVNVKTYRDVWGFDDENGPVPKGWQSEFHRSNIPVIKACDGKLYLNFEVDAIGVTGTGLGKSKLELYSKGKLVGTEYFYISQ